MNELINPSLTIADFPENNFEMVVLMVKKGRLDMSTLSLKFEKLDEYWDNISWLNNLFKFLRKNKDFRNKKFAKKLRKAFKDNITELEVDLIVENRKALLKSFKYLNNFKKIKK